MNNRVSRLSRFGSWFAWILAAAVIGGLLIAAPTWLSCGMLLLLAAVLATRWGRQTRAITRLGIQSIPRRLGTSSVVIVGIAGVVGVLVGLLSMATGFEAALRQTGRNDTAIVLRAGAQSELYSVIDHDSANLISEAAGVAQDAAGHPIVSPELVVVASLPRRGGAMDANVELRGIGPLGWDLRPGLKIIAGRKFAPGLHELVVGKDAVAQFAGIGVGSSLDINGQKWTIVGEFDSGDSYSSEIWGDKDVVGPAYHRGNSADSVLAKLKDAAAFQTFARGLASEPRLKVDVYTTLDYYTTQSAQLTRLIRTIGIGIGCIMAIGAVFGALNSMYAAVTRRTRELATLRALGFGAAPLIASLLIETLLLGLGGGLLGGGLVWLLLNNLSLSTSAEGFSQIAFAFAVTWPLVLTGLKWALAIAFVGGLLPALAAARLNIPVGLRAR